MNKFVSIDIETTGLDDDTCQILEIGAVVASFDGKVLDTFHCYVDHDLFVGEPYAFAMNQSILYKIAELKRTPESKRDALLLPPEDACLQLRVFLSRNYDRNEKITIAGKNFGGFDKGFLKEAGFFNNTPFLRVSHKYLDPGNLYFNPETDIDLPDQAECCRRAGIPDEVTHLAVDDAMQVVKLVVYYYQNISPYRKATTAVRIPRARKHTA